VLSQARIYKRKDVAKETHGDACGYKSAKKSERVGRLLGEQQVAMLRWTRHLSSISTFYFELLKISRETLMNTNF